ncbi:alpha/beta fold hydrolase [Embleya sp. NPDC050493]|uniref:alpha/beta fold hydrolase n=1 Tax=Embleya sp. NPDC050493 TaxID=3363989 RepID=UPI00379F1C2A
MTSSQAHDEQLLRVDGVELCAQTFGDPAAPALLLIGGAEASMDWWDDEFCAGLAAGGRHVIRYDTRDTGRSTTFPPGEPPYGSDALLDDAVGLLDALGIASAHIVGVSMGGDIAQHLAVHHPERVASLTLVATSPGGPGGPAHPDLPPMSKELAEQFAEGGDEAPDWSDREAVIAYYTAGERTFAGTIPVDEERVRRVVGRAWDRSPALASAQNHWRLDGGEPVRDRLGEITAPTLVLHGTADPLFPYGHGEALAREIPGARLVPLSGMGHQMPPPELWDIAIPAILSISEARPTT